MKWLIDSLARLFFLILRLLVNASYNIFRLFHKRYISENVEVTFLSRQNNSITTDFDKLSKELRNQYPDVKINILMSRFRGKQDNIFRFAKNCCLSIKYIAKSRVCVLDSYWPVISVLKTKDRPTNIQIWHSLSKIKKSGYQTVGKPGGRSNLLAHSLRMHCNYDYVITTGSYWTDYYVQAFRINRNNILNYGTPRMEYLQEIDINSMDVSNLKEEYGLYNQKTILYIPTYRNYSIDEEVNTMMEFANKNSFNLIIRLHPNQVLSDELRECVNEKFSRYAHQQIIKLFAISDIIVSDYSSLIVESLILNKKIVFYTGDIEKYLQYYGLNFNPERDIPELCFRNIQDLGNILEAYCWEQYYALKKIFLPDTQCSSTKKIVDLIAKEGGFCERKYIETDGK